jgi:hypothetical protein
LHDLADHWDGLQSDEDLSDDHYAHNDDQSDNDDTNSYVDDGNNNIGCGCVYDYVMMGTWDGGRAVELVSRVVHAAASSAVERLLVGSITASFDYETRESRDDE